MSTHMLEFRPGFYAVLLSVLLTATGAGQAQQIPQPDQSASQLPDAPSAVARVSDGWNGVNIFPTGSGLHLLLSGGKTALWTGSFMDYIPGRMVLEQQTLVHKNLEMLELLASDDSPILSAGVDHMVFPPSYTRQQPKAVHSLDDWQYYGHHIPVAGPVVLRVGEEALAHPHIVSVLKVIQPQF